MSAEARLRYREAFEGAFVGCPGDAELFETRLRAVWGRLSFPGVRPKLYHWKKDYDFFAGSAAIGDQFQIAQTSAAEVDPVFILIGRSIGTPVRPPPEGWDGFRAWLNARGWGFIALLGEPDFQQIEAVPDRKVPLTGTLFELFDAMRSVPATQLKIYDLSAIAPPDPAGTEQQRGWQMRLMSELRISVPVARPLSMEAFERQAEHDLRSAFGLSRLDPRTDELPGLQSIEEGVPLLFARGPLIEALSERVLHDKAPVTLLVGVSGAGKSSLMRAGLMGTWYRTSPRGPALRAGVQALLVEPDMLQRHNRDPLHALADLLFGAKTAPEERVIGPWPQALAGPVRLLPEPTGDRLADAQAALAWWHGLTAPAASRLVLLFDQAEQIEAQARREAQVRVDRDGRADPTPRLSPQWRRLIDLIAVLSGIAQPELRPAAAAQGPVIQLVLGLHRLSALDLWELDREALPVPEQVPALEGQMVWREVIDGTLAAYGLRLDPDLRNAMVEEAQGLVEQQQSVQPAQDADDRTVFALASVLPQVKTALLRIMEAWLRLKRDNTLLDEADLLLDRASYEPFAGVTFSIDLLGEAAWDAWRKDLSVQRHVDLRGLLERQQLGQDMAIAFNDLMAGLVDAGRGTQRELIYLGRASPRARRQDTLIRTLRGHRLLTSTDAAHLRLPHRSVLDHWRRAFSWLETVVPRLEVKRVVAGYRAAELPSAAWAQDRMESIVDLALNWIGSGDGEDGMLLGYVQAGLTDRIDPAQVDPQSKTLLQRLPFTLLATGERDWFRLLHARCELDGSWPERRGVWLIWLCESGDLAAVDRLIASVDGSDRFALVNYVHRIAGVFPLLFSAERGHEEVVKSLLKAGAVSNRDNQVTGASPLLIAAAHGHTGIVKALLEAGADHSRVNPKNGTFPLLLASQQGHAEMVKALLAAGADPDHAHTRGGFPLLIAAQNGHEEVVKALLEARAHPNRDDPSTGIFPLLMAAQNGHEEVVKALLEACADPNRIHIRGTFPLLMAAQNGHAEVVKALLEAGADPNRDNPNDGNFPMLQAAAQGHAPVVRVLLAARVEPHRDNPSTGAFPLLQAAQNGHEEVVKALLEAHADPNRDNPRNGIFPLLQAAQNGHAEVVKALLTASADPNRDSPSTGAFPLLIAAQYGHAEVVKALLEARADPNRDNPNDGTFPLLIAAENGHISAVKVLLEARADPNRVHSVSAFPLLIASENGHTDVIKALLKARADPNRDNPSNGAFPLLIAAHNGYAEAVKALLEAGADPNRAHTNGTFPLLLAAQNGHAAVVKALLEARADLHRDNPVNGAFPLLIAAEQGHAVVVKALLGAGADPNRGHNPTGSTALDVAIGGRHLEIIAILLQRSDVFAAIPDDKKPLFEKLGNIFSDNLADHVEEVSDPSLLTDHARQQSLTLAIGLPIKFRVSDEVISDFHTLSIVCSRHALGLDGVSVDWSCDRCDEIPETQSFWVTRLRFSLELSKSSAVEALAVAAVGMAPVPLIPGFDLDGWAFSLSNQRRPLDLRHVLSAKLWAALVLLFSAKPSVP